VRRLVSSAYKIQAPGAIWEELTVLTVIINKSTLQVLSLQHREALEGLKSKLLNLSYSSLCESFDLLLINIVRVFKKTLSTHEVVPRKARLASSIREAKLEHFNARPEVGNLPKLVDRQHYW